VEELCFACDAMLGTLARWLRFAGFDTSFEAGVDDDVLAAGARNEGRWLLTRDRALAAASGPRVVLLRAISVAGQVEELRTRLPLVVDRERFFSRCSECNGVLRDAARSEVEHRVPPFVAATAARFRVCPRCSRVYWPGTHTARIVDRLEALFG
jgi:uncharacterized protein with PIN domain